MTGPRCVTLVLQAPDTKEITVDGIDYQTIDRIKSACFGQRDEHRILRNLDHLARNSPHRIRNLARVIDRGEMSLALDALRGYLV